MKLKQLIETTGKPYRLYDVLKHHDEFDTLNIVELKKAVDFKKALHLLIKKAKELSERDHTGTIEPLHNMTGKEIDFSTGIQNYGNDLIMHFNVEHKDRKGHHYSKAVKLNLEELKDL
jgi:hypothetical protein